MAICTVESVKFEHVPYLNQTVGVWVLCIIPNGPATLIVPGLESTSAAKTLNGVFAGATPVVNGENGVGLSGAPAGTLVLTTLHRKGMFNNLTIDEAPE